MADGSRKVQPKGAANPSSLFTDLLDRIAKDLVPIKQPEPQIKVAVVEEYARQMAKLGYEFSGESLKMLASYLKGYNLLVIGQVGIGKTFFFDCINEIRRSQYRDRLIKLSMLETQGWKMEDAKEWIDDYSDCDVLIDDVGTEPKMRSWGQEAELFPYLLEMRMKLRRGQYRTHMTTNKTLPEIEERYGRRVRDRLNQMFKFVPLTAKKSRRKDSLVPWRVPETRDGVI